jgi:tetratricopeptide (TPR) repeat protein
VNSDLVELDKRALALRNAGQLEEAVNVLIAIVEKRPDWEHGMALYNLASCYEDLHNYDLAAEFYRKALACEKKNPIFIGGLASLLFIRGDFDHAFETYLRLLEVEQCNKHVEGIRRAFTGLKALGKKMALSEGDVIARIRARNLPLPNDVIT